MTALPADVVHLVREVFASCNAASTRKLTMAPNIQEEWLDHTWISEVTNFTSPQVVESGWLVRFDAHYLGSRLDCSSTTLLLRSSGPSRK